MKKAVQLFVTALLVTCVVFVFAGCIDNKEKTYVEQYAQITADLNDEIGNISNLDTSTVEGFQEFLDMIDSIDEQIHKLADLDPPEKFQEAQECYRTASKGITEANEIFQSLDPEAVLSGDENAYSQYVDALNKYMEACDELQKGDDAINAANR